MSIAAVSWALDYAPVSSAQEHVILLALADRADETGRGAWAFQDKLAGRARCSGRTVRRHLAKMLGRGLIALGDQRAVAHIRRDKRPVVYDLDLTRRLTADELAAFALQTPIDPPDNLSGGGEDDEPIPDLASDVRPDDLSAGDFEPDVFGRMDQIYDDLDRAIDGISTVIDRTSGASPTPDDRPAKLSGRTQLWSSDRTPRRPTERVERVSTGDVLGERPVSNALARTLAQAPPAPEQFHAEHPDAWVDGCAECDEYADRWMNFRQQLADAARAGVPPLGARPSERCAKHLTDPNPPSCGGCKAKRVEAEKWDRERDAMAAAAAAARRSAVVVCDQTRAAAGLPPLCDSEGWRIPPPELADPPVAKCDHRTADYPPSWVALLAALADDDQVPAGPARRAVRAQPEVEPEPELDQHVTEPEGEHAHA